jgi:hypothetical protein
MTQARTPRGRLSIALTIATVMMTAMALGGGTALAGTGRLQVAHRHLKDSDHDGMPNVWERLHHTNPHKPDANADPDKDGLKNLGEFKAHTLPHKADTDSDGLFDGAEVHQFHTNPRLSDTDGDGTEDGSDDSNGDGVPDDGEDGNQQDGFVGTIVSFDAAAGVLTFESATAGEPVTVLVTDRTEVSVSENCGDDDGGNDQGGNDGQDAPAPRCHEGGGTDLLQEGVDIVSIHFGDHLVDGLPVATEIVVACPNATPNP